jgi:4-hydroxy-3-methylbut-2-en-1-yl diphosphate reductase
LSVPLWNAEFWKRSMEIIIDPQAGFCPGVFRAIELLEQRLRKGEQVTALGALIHNRREIKRLEKMGLQTVSQESAIAPLELAKLKGRELFVRTHGVGEAVQKSLRESGLQVLDGTCSTVRRVQKLAALHHQRGDQVVIIGKKKHAEVLGILGYCDDQAIVVESAADVESIDPERPTVVVAQTTAGLDHFKEMCEVIRLRVQQLNCIDTTCRFISRRHEHIRAFAASVDVLLFVGGRESSNSEVLFEICRLANPRSRKIEAPEELKPEWINPEDSIGITGGASTPLWQFEEIRDRLLGKPASA